MLPGRGLTPPLKWGPLGPIQTTAELMHGRTILSHASQICPTAEQQRRVTGGWHHRGSSTAVWRFLVVELAAWPCVDAAEIYAVTATGPIRALSPALQTQWSLGSIRLFEQTGRGLCPLLVMLQDGRGRNVPLHSLRPSAR